MFGNIVSLVERYAEVMPEEIALVVTGDVPERCTWAELEQEAARLAAAFTARGVAEEDGVGCYLRNSREYVVTFLAALKVGAIPMNFNYRYQADELGYLVVDSGARVVVADHDLMPNMLKVLDGVATPPVVLQVGEAMDSCSEEYHAVAASMDPAPRINRTGDELLCIYTGGTTGMPKGVLWKVCDFFAPAIERNVRFAGGSAEMTPDGVIEAAVNMRRSDGHQVTYVLPPLVHGLGLGSAMSCLAVGVKLVLNHGGHFEASAAWRTVADESVRTLSIVGEAFARPLLDALGELDSLTVDQISDDMRRIVSSGATWSRGTKLGLLDLLDVDLVDGVGSTETRDMAMSWSSRESEGVAAFRISDQTRVVAPDFVDVVPGSGQVGQLIGTGFLPIGYLGDAEKTAATFVEREGRRWALSGDFATVEGDGTIRLLGRGSACINSGGEKIYPGEVEEVVSRLPDVRDCLVVGVPHERWGEVPGAVVVTDHGSSLSAGHVITAVRDNLAGYKVPKEVVITDEPLRHENGKGDYSAAKRMLTLAQHKMVRPTSCKTS